jgi:hypothetical protein
MTRHPGNGLQFYARNTRGVIWGWEWVWDWGDGANPWAGWRLSHDGGVDGDLASTCTFFLI